MTDVRLLEALRGGGRRVNVWTVNSLGRMRELLAFGCDGLITDLPDVARKAVQDAAGR
jgi:glycerophosphoryl diester phosphodiesterase